MILWIFAHRLEASSIIDDYGFKKQDIQYKVDLYKCPQEKMILLVCGESEHHRVPAIAYVYSLYGNKINKVINMGLAASVREELEIGKIYSIRTSYFSPGGAPAYQSYSSADGDASIDCLSYRGRLQNKQDARNFSFFAHLVDREIWSIMGMASFLRVPVYSYKLVSDRGREISLDLIQKNGEKWSEELLKYAVGLIKKLKSTEKKEEIQNLGLYLTKTQKNIYKRYLNILKQRYGTEEEDLKKEEKIRKILDSSLKSKDKTKKILDYLYKKIDPVTTEYEKKVHQYLGDLKEKGFEFQQEFFPEERLKISFKIKTHSELKKRLNHLQQLDYSQYHKSIFGGEV